MKKHAKQARANRSAGRVKNQTKNQKTEFDGQSIELFIAINSALRLEKNKETKERLLLIQGVAQRLVRIGVGVLEAKANSELLSFEDACYKAADLLSLMSVVCAPLIENSYLNFPGDGIGLSNLATDAARQLMDGLRAAHAESQRNGGAQ
jgi:hypothetical protein